MKNENPAYLSDSFGDRATSLRSAEVIVPIVIDLLKPGSVIDIGCGNGEFLSVFKKLGITDIFGVDGKWVDIDKLKISNDKFLHHDLNLPLSLDRKFDLAISLEVAEHLPEKNADNFVVSLCSLAPCVVFSAAIPFQGGIHHVNEQWPGYWQEKFARLGYVGVDCIRSKIWSEESVNFWYAQNTFLFINKDFLNLSEGLNEAVNNNNQLLALVHPEMYLLKSKKLEKIKSMIPEFIHKLIKKVFNKSL